MNIAFMGTPQFAVPALEALCHIGLRPKLVVTQPAARRGRGSETESSPVAKAAKSHGIPVCETGDVCSGEAFEQLKGVKPDLICVVAFGQILKDNVLTLAKHGCINLHPSMLPAYRGAAPIQRAIMDGLAATGITVMRLVKKLDAGPILMQSSFVLAGLSSEQALEGASHAGGEMIADVARRYANGNPPTEVAQADALATYAKPLEKHEGEIAFDKPARMVAAQARAVTPWPKASTWLHQKDKPAQRLIINVAEVPLLDNAHDIDIEFPAGTVTAADESGIYVACKPGMLRILRLQREGKAPLDAAEFLKGLTIEPGDTLGPQ